MTASPPVLEPSRKKARGRPRGDARDRILRAARKLLATERYDAVSVPEIVAEAGVAQGTFYLYFQSKADLIGAMSDAVQAAIAARIPACLDQDAPVMVVLERLLDVGASVSRDHADILPFLGTEGLLFGASSRAEALKAPYLARLSALILRDQEAGLLRRDMAADHAARFVSAILDQVARDVSRNPMSDKTEAYQSEAIRFLRHALSEPEGRTTDGV